MAGLWGLSLLLTGCSRDLPLLRERSPDGKAELQVTDKYSWGCGSDGCIEIGLQTEEGYQGLFRLSGWVTCFTAGAWSADSRGVAIVASNCFGGPIWFYYDLEHKRRETLYARAALLRRKIAQDYHVEEPVNVLEWVQTQQAHTAWFARRAQEKRKASRETQTPK